MCHENELINSRRNLMVLVPYSTAFDTADHELLFLLLEHYGAPPKLIDVIRHLHNEFKLELKLDAKNHMEIDYTAGIRQGVNMAPILFLFLIQAFNESYAKHNI